MIVGIGLNINQASFNTDYAATSLSLELGRSLDLDEELSLLLPYINSCIDIVKGGRADEIEVSYLARLRGSQGFAKFSDEEASYRGKIVFVDNSGEITVKSEDRKLKNYRSGEVKITY
jgi:biotin-(acetyl-CoA carboxylase) ligase